MTSLLPLLRYINLKYPCYLSRHNLDSYFSEKEIGILDKAGVVVQVNSAKEIPCQSCDEGHLAEVLYDEDIPFVLCSRGGLGKLELSREEIQRWRFDIIAVLDQAKNQFHIRESIKPIMPGSLWSVGELTKRKARYLIFYNRTEDLDSVVDLLKRLSSPIRNVVVLTNTETLLPSKLSSYQVIVIPLVEIISLKRGRVSWDKQIFTEYLKKFQRVQFKENGELIIDGKLIVIISPGDPLYSFVQILYDNFNQIIPYLEILDYCKSKHKIQGYTNNPRAFCHKMKNKLIRLSNKPQYVDKLIESGEDNFSVKGYRMTDPW